MVLYVGRLNNGTRPRLDTCSHVICEKATQRHRYSLSINGTRDQSQTHEACAASHLIVCGKATSRQRENRFVCILFTGVRLYFFLFHTSQCGELHCCLGNKIRSACFGRTVTRGWLFVGSETDIQGNRLSLIRGQVFIHPPHPLPLLTPPPRGVAPTPDSDSPSFRLA